MTSPMNTTSLVRHQTYTSYNIESITTMVTGGKSGDTNCVNNHQNNDNMDVTIVAITQIPANVSTLPFITSLSLSRIFNTNVNPVNCVLKAYVSQMDTLCVDQHIDWIPLVTIAKNCFEQNLTANLTHNKTAIVLTTIRAIDKGEELRVWPSDQLILAMNIPFLKPQHIINGHCYRCDRCGHSFAQPNPLKIHLSINCKSNHMDNLLTNTNIVNNSPITSTGHSAPAISEAKAHTCLYCGKIYTRKYGLKIHVRTHTGQKPLRCRYCGRPFSDPSNLNKHIRLHAQHNTVGSGGHPSTPYKCKLCGKVLVRRRDLERHIKSRHQSI